MKLKLTAMFALAWLTTPTLTENNGDFQMLISRAYFDLHRLGPSKVGVRPPGGG